MGKAATSVLERPEADVARPPCPQMLHHAAFVTHDAAATVDFYTNVVGWKLVHAIFNDHVPSTDDKFPYVHLFFQLPDGSSIAFFESVDLPPAAEDTHPAYQIFNHFAWKASSPAEVESWKKFLEEKSIDFVGPTDHGICTSIYFYDPNGIRLEVVADTADWANEASALEAADHMRQWTQMKEDFLAKRSSVTPAEWLAKHRTHKAPEPVS